MKARSKARRDGLGSGKGRKTRKAPLGDKAVGHIDDRPHEPIVKAFKGVYDWAKQEIDEFAGDFIEILETAEVTQSDEAILRAGGYQSDDIYSWNKPESNKPDFWLDPEGGGYESCFQYRLEEQKPFCSVAAAPSIRFDLPRRAYVDESETTSSDPVVQYRYITYSYS